LDTKKAILTAIGKNITLLDGKIHIEPEEWFVPIADNYPALERQYKMFEPDKNTTYSSISSKIEAIRTDWLARVDKVKTKLLSLNEDIFIPELSFQ
jgi:hypothetical protein